MAKNRSGLGRGLGALMGDDAVENVSRETSPSKPVETAPASVVQERTKPVNNQEKSAVTVREERYTRREPPRKASSSLNSPTPPKQEPNPNDISDIREALRAQNKNKHTYVEEDDHVTIKSVMQREAKPDDKVDISMVVPNPDQPRSNFKEEELEELADSISKNGLLQPILVRKINNMYQIIAGERRWQAAKRAGLKKVPVSIIEADDDKVIELALIENIQRSDLNPIEEAYGYKRLMDRRGMTQSEIAQVVSKGRSTIANSLRLLELPEIAQQLLFEEKITAGHARAILSVPTIEGKKILTARIVDNGLSVRDAENIARLLSGKKKEEKPAGRQPVPKEYKTVAKNLTKFLGMPVKVKSSKGKNKLEIEFKDQDELESLFGKIVPEE